MQIVTCGGDVECLAAQNGLNQSHSFHQPLHLPLVIKTRTYDDTTVEKTKPKVKQIDIFISKSQCSCYGTNIVTPVYPMFPKTTV